uniref:Exonuclease 1 n=1 Tax=Diabrotica virgifera virgifera TaxID=50390 RepID=A0A6P7FRW3_DIAVI
MGIRGLLSYLKSAERECHINEFKQKTIAVDSFSWLFKGADLMNPAKDDGPNSLVNYCLNNVNLLLNHDIKPIMVFDGKYLPVKKEIKELQTERMQPREKRTHIGGFKRSIRKCNTNFHPAAIRILISECQKMKVDCIVAPYEADAQIGYLTKLGVIDAVIAEDSDLVLFGCQNIIYKLDDEGQGVLLERDKIPQDELSFDQLIYTCILAGCNYSTPLAGMSLNKAESLVKLSEEKDPIKILEELPKDLNVTDQYKDEFMGALAVYKHQVVFDPFEKKLVHLTEPDLKEPLEKYCTKVGTFFDDSEAYQIAIGNLNPINNIKRNYWDPKNSAPHSIWSSQRRNQDDPKEGGG